MGDNLVLALEITAIGMSLVFAAILLFWLIMALLVRVTAERGAPAADLAGEAEPALAPAAADRQHELRRRAAAAAVVAALSLEPTAAPGLFPLPPTALVSAWQAVMRANTLKQRGPLR